MKTSLLRNLFLFSVFSLVLFFLSINFAQAQEKDAQATSSGIVAPVKSYDVFWPLVAGKVMGEPFYSLKSFKESVREILSFSSSKKADFNITLAEKRVLEAEKLFLEKKNYEIAKKTLDIAQEKREKSFELLMKSGNSGRNIDDLKNRYINSLQKQQALLNYMQTLVSENEKSNIQKNVDSLNSILEKFQ